MWKETNPCKIRNWKIITLKTIVLIYVLIYLWINTNLFIFIWISFSLQSRQPSSKMGPHYCFNLHRICLWMMSKILYLCHTSYSATLFYLSFFHFLLSIFFSGVYFLNLFFNWRNLEPVRQSEVNQKKKNKYLILTHIYGI